MDALQLPLNNKEVPTATRSSNLARNSSVASPTRQTSFTPWDNGDEDREPAQRSGGFMESPAIRTMNQKPGHSVRTSKEIEVDDHGSGDS
ncbi:hypothetical protein RvY_13732 [Ramazzottius varieornatus]|uniref:Uncharacterized protein n=1 Tax=Ramazzottius varieornatus TaxID=947166 RepID=A0A1D1VR25_RAMVA|nr:hypothetical protein RvY_13732 [Ramazzottius varieornatus]